MATPRKTPVVNPLLDELPPEVEAKPVNSDEVHFEVEFTPTVAGGNIVWTWKILDHNAKTFIDDYSGTTEGKYESLEMAQSEARRFISRVRETLDLKLTAPDPVRMTL